ncbi:PREDICTED: HLA class II histocompatibility antigen, DRB1-4 beta chain-like, partial [Myotis brandtii]|uniref:HLA class II histocompatibility antigen, DRB1-4 beta chain-like n=1 Tax=Myotis brandtii TaxID=109478 RepID=UPI000703F9B6
MPSAAHCVQNTHPNLTESSGPNANSAEACLVLPVPSAHFLEQVKQECHFSNGTERVRYLLRYIYNGQDYVLFDSDLGEFQAVTELGRPEEKGWNSQEDLLEQKRAMVDKYCRHNYGVSEGFLVPLQTEPTVTVYP